MGSFFGAVWWIVPLKLLALMFFNLYKGMWRYTSIHDLANLVKACLSSSAAIFAVLIFTVRFGGFARSVFIIDLLLTFLFIGGYRVGIRLFYFQMEGKSISNFIRKSGHNIKNLVIIGAGDAGEKARQGDCCDDF